MGDIISILKGIFMGQDDNCTQVGLSSFKNASVPIKQVSKKTHTPKELKLSDLMRKSSY